LRFDSTFSFSVFIFSSNNAILSTSGALSAECSRCAFDKKPKIPIEVINIKITTAIDRYDLIRKGHSLQFLYNQDTVTSFDISSIEPIMTTGQKDPGNIWAKPITE